MKTAQYFKDILKELQNYDVSLLKKSELKKRIDKIKNIKELILICENYRLKEYYLQTEYERLKNITNEIEENKKHFIDRHGELKKYDYNKYLKEVKYNDLQYKLNNLKQILL